MPHSIFRWDSKDRLMIVASGRVACGTVLVVALLVVPSNCVSGEEVRCSFKPVSAGILLHTRRTNCKRFDGNEPNVG